MSAEEEGASPTKPWIDEAARLIMNRFGVDRKNTSVGDIAAVIAQEYRLRDASRSDAAIPDWMKRAAGEIDVLFGLPRFDLMLEWTAETIAEAYRQRT